VFEVKHKALSIKRPWARLIFGLKVDNDKGYLKDIENRDWPLWRYFKREELPIRVYIHVPQKDDSAAMEWLMDRGIPPMYVLQLYTDRFYKGGIIGEIDIVDCVTESESPWFVGKYGFVLDNPQLYDKPIPCKGRLGFFTPELTDVEVFRGY